MLPNTELLLMSKKKFVVRHYWTGWVDIPVVAEDQDEAYELADEIYNSGEYEENEDNSGFENTEVEIISEEEIGDTADAISEAQVESRRTKPLEVGDLVFDYGVQKWGRITGIHLEQCDEEEYGCKEMLIYDLEMDDWCEQENKRMFDSEIPDDELKWDTACEEDLYAIAEGLVARDGNPVCYEHQKTEDDYPYFSPYLDENLFSIEVWFKK